MLTQRARATEVRIGGLDLDSSSVGVVVDRSETVLAAWEQAERDALKPDPPKPKPAPPILSDERLKGREDVFAKSRAMNETAAKLMDQRSAADFQAEVDAYVAKGRSRLPSVLIRGAIDHRRGRLHIRVTNATTRNLHQVRIALEFGVRGVKAYTESDLGHVQMPERPLALGKGGALARGFGRAIRLPSVGLNPAAFSRTEIDNSHSARITFEPLDLYPETSEDLETIYLVAEPEYAGVTLRGRWTAVAKNLDGTQTGTLDIKVSEVIPTIADLRKEPSWLADDDD
jgi:hypothetical protein